ncbi:helix-loop-helix DNA-binding domain-containing protein [Spinellus fusiger]|nr:helix-loop-helix DNA-binding domain-containing protein [Spinellus fusiger]
MTERTPLKLSNPTRYHLMAQEKPSVFSNDPQGMDIFSMEDTVDYGESFSHKFLSPMTSPLDFEDLAPHTRAMETETSPSEYSADFFSPPSCIGPMEIVHHSTPSQSHATHTTLSHEKAQWMTPTPSAYSFYTPPPFLSSSGAAHTTVASAAAAGAPTTHTTTTMGGMAMGGFPMSAPATLGYDLGSHFGSPCKINPMTMSPRETSTHPPSRSYEEDYETQLVLQTMMEKRRRRRESHNAVERRRRENINDKIQELCSLLPEAMLDEIHQTMNAANGLQGINAKPNKGAILRKSVDHIRLLQEEAHAHRHRIQELESILAQENRTA